jgi:hypothetical protein
MVRIRISTANQNASVQVGDHAYYSTVDAGSNLNAPIHIGEIISVAPSYIDVEGFGNGVSNQDYIMFKKNNQVNKSGIKGYYSEFKFTTSSTAPQELFSVGSEVVESSK